MQLEFMRLAIQLSRENVSSGRGGPFGAVIVKDGQVLATGANRVTADNDPTAHAEVVAIRHACRALGSFQLTDCDLYTSCEPCPMCLGAIYWARPARIYYANSREDAAAAGFDDKFIYDEIACPIDQRRIPAQQLLRDEALVAFHDWVSGLSKIPY